MDRFFPACKWNGIACLLTVIVPTVCFDVGRNLLDFDVVQDMTEGRVQNCIR